MTPLLYVALGFVAGAVLVYLLERRVRAYLTSELAYYRKELATAQDRLVHAWREDRAVIPPRPVPVEPPKPLPPELRDAVNDWESPEARATAEANLRSLYFDKGWGVMAILRHLEDQHP
jgi:hypothetical protein